MMHGMVAARSASVPSKEMSEPIAGSAGPAGKPVAYTESDILHAATASFDEK